MALKHTIPIILFILLVPAGLAVYPGDPGFRGCVIANPDGPGQYDDIDCDRVPDVFDNCPLTPNEAQTDIDNNGVGDFCDLVIDEIRVEPEQGMQGRSVLVRAWLFNSRSYPIRNLVVKLEVPRLGLLASEQISLIRPEERASKELIVRIPECARPEFTDFIVIAEYPYAAGEKEVFSRHFKVPIVESGRCPETTDTDTSIVDIIELQDVDRQHGAIYPFTIHNRETESKAYILGVSGLDGWGSAVILPSSVMVIPQGESREGEIRLFAGEDIPAGERSFLFTVNSRDDSHQTVLLADVLESQLQANGLRPGARLFLGLIAFVGVLAIIGLILVFVREKHKRHIERKTRKNR